jgi:hypothetical protein
MQAYRLESNSPMINSGLNLYNLFGFEVGTIDFFGNHLFTGPGTDIGFYESPVQSEIKVPLTGEDDVLVFPNPIEKGNSFKVKSKMPMESIRLISSEGRYVLEEKPRDSFCRVNPSPGLTAGMYFLQILNQRGDLIIKKVLVE